MSCESVAVWYNKDMILKLQGRVPSKKNQRNIFTRNGKIVNIPSKDYATWHTEQMWLLKKYKPKKPLKNVDVAICITAGDNRKSDLSNKCESIMDLLVDSQIIEDDNWFCVGRLDMRFGGVQKNKPCAVIEIT